jgi:intracellular sulfur oxidation DsrE/DsrF family protein
MFVRRSLAAALLTAVSGAAFGGPADLVQPIDKVDPYVAVPGGAFLADNKHVYRVVFEARHGADKPDQLAPAVNMAGTELNTLAAHHVKRKNARFVVVFHTVDSDEAVLDNAHYRAKHGVDNPNLPVLAALRRQGVLLFVCGQELLADHVPLDAVSKDVTIAEDGVVVLMSYGADGYAHLTF